MYTNFTHREHGAATVIVALLMVALLTFVALGVDLAVLYRDRAQLQAQADLVALGAAADVADASTRVAQGLTGNALPQDALVDLQVGRYLRNPAIAPEDRFTPLPTSDPAANAVVVRLNTTAPLSFGRILTDQTALDIFGTATASRTGAASFSLNSNLLRLDTTTLNALFTDAFGVSATLTTNDIDAFASTTVSLGAVIERAAATQSVAPTNPADVLATTMTVADLLHALRDEAPMLSTRLARLQPPGLISVSVSDLVSTSDRDIGVTLIDFVRNTEVTVLDLLIELSQAVMPSSPRAIDVTTATPALTSLDVDAIIFEPPAQSGEVMVGEVSATLHTADARLRADMELAPNILGTLGTGIQATRLHLPFYAEIAGATATLTELACSGTAPDDILAQFSTLQRALSPTDGTAIAALHIGDLPDATFADAQAINPADVGFVDVVDLSLTIEVPLLPDVVIDGITLQIRGSTSVGASQTEEIAFTRADVAAGDLTRYFGSGDLLSTAIDDLFANETTEIRVHPDDENRVSTLAAPLVDAAIQALPGQLLASVAAPVDSIMDDTLSTVGLRLGEGELTLLNHHCSGVQLVQ